MHYHYFQSLSKKTFNSIHILFRKHYSILNNDIFCETLTNKIEYAIINLKS